MRRLWMLSLLFAGITASLAGQNITLPNTSGSLKFAVLGDTGTGGRDQYAVGSAMATSRARFPFEFAIMVGDNLYGGESARDYANKFEKPYKALLDGGVKFYAALGNHDDPNQRLYKAFNMNGERYYSFRPKLGVRFFALDSNYMDQKQLDWLTKELAASGSDWKIAFFHHPPYSSGMHGSNLILRDQVEPLFVKHGVTTVFTGHEHFYERIKPQKGIAYFVAGSSAKLRKGDIATTPLTAKGFDSGFTYMLVEIAGDEMHFQVLTDKGQTIDSGVIRKIDTAAGPKVVATTGAKPPANGAKPANGATPPAPNGAKAPANPR